MLNGTTTQFLIDPFGLGNVASEFTSTGTLIAHYTQGLGLVSRVDAGGAAAYYDFDVTGNTVGLTDAAGSYVNRYSYQPFGQTTAIAVVLPNRFTFVGQFGAKSDGNGTFNMRLRNYDPSTGQFLSADPLGIAGGDTNIRRYVGNNPVNQIDPSGLSCDDLVKRYWDHFREIKSSSAFKIPIIGGPLGLNYAIRVAVALVGAAFATVGDVLSGLLNGITNAHGDPPNASSGAGSGGGSGSCQLPPRPAPPPVPTKPGAAGTTKTAGSSDPNAKAGPGFGPAGFVAAASVLPYRIEFENDAKATAPAQRVDITDRLDSKLDWNTFELTDIGFGDFMITVPAGSQHFQTTVAMTYNGRTFNVQIEVGLHSDTGLVYAMFQSIDPATSLPPDVLTGFLPPQDGTGRGQGHFSYIIRPKAGLPTGTQIRNVALVTFDLGETIATDQVDDHDPSKGTDPAKEALVTIDALPPTSTVSPLPALSPASFTVSWSGQDDAGGSGIASYDIYVSDNNGPFTLWLGATTHTSATYPGVSGHGYGFYSIATDHVGNRQTTPPAAEAATQVKASTTITWINAAGGDWDTSGNWDLHRVPSADDDVVINVAGITVTHAFARADALHRLTSQARISLSAGSLAIAGPSVINATFTISGGTLFLIHATLAGSGMLVNGGTVAAQGDSAINVPFTTTANSTLRVLGSNAADAALRVATGFANNGSIELTSAGAAASATLTVAGGTLTNTAGANINFLAGAGGSRTLNARLDNQGTLTIAQNGRNFTPTGAFTNAVTLNIGYGSTFTANGAYSQTGSAVVRYNGTLILAGGGSNSGSFTVAQAGLVLWVAGTFTLDAGTELGGPGLFQIAGATVSIADVVRVPNVELDSGVLTVAGALTIINSFTWTGGTMSGTGSTTLASGSLFTISGAADKALAGQTLNLGGTTTWSDKGSLIFANKAAINNQSGAQFLIMNDQSIQGSGRFSNAGTLVKTVGTGTTSFDTGIAFANDGGTVDVESGTLRFAGDYTQNSGDTILAGGATLAAGGTVNILDGTLSGSGTIRADVVNSGQIDPVGILTIRGNYTQMAKGVLNIAISGTTAGADYDQLVVTGLATLDGTLNVSITNGFLPNVGNPFQVLIFGARGGDFAVENGLDLGGGIRLDPQYDGNSLNLVTMGGNPPPPGPAAQPNLKRTQLPTESAAATGSTVGMMAPNCIDAYFELLSARARSDMAALPCIMEHAQDWATACGTRARIGPCVRVPHPVVGRADGERGFSHDRES